MHAGAGLGDDAFLAHAPCQQDLADAVVNLVRAGVVQLFALEINLCAAAELGQAFSEIQRTRTADVITLEVGQFFFERRIFLGRFVFAGQIEDQRHQGFRHVAATERAEQAVGVRAVTQIRGVRSLGHESLQVNSGQKTMTTTLPLTFYAENR
ncbi:hypothetical protein D3C71_172400 [compost metagenome]